MLTQRSAKRIIKINHETTNYQHDFYAYWFYLMKEQEEKIMSENLNIDVAAMLNQLPPEMQKQMQAQMQTFINIMKGGQNAVVPQAGPSAINKKRNTGESR